MPLYRWFEMHPVFRQSRGKYITDFISIVAQLGTTWHYAWTIPRNYKLVVDTAK